ncbi:MAG: RDD family protein [Bifidobacteriaceae bacterium]|nr:RDD family protein [Bifidobacteriaceae bacterium]
MQGDELVVGEAVKLELLPASFGNRFVAFLIDLVVMIVATIALIWALLRWGLFFWDAAMAQAAVSAAAALLLLVFPITVETLSRGRSLGKLVMGLRVVNDDGSPVVLRQTFIRAVVAVLEVWVTFGAVAGITMMVNGRGKRIGDLLAGTYAMRIRGVSLQVLALQMPPELAYWAALADTGGVSDSLALRARQFLLRAGSLSPPSRAQLGLALAAEVAAATAPPPPPRTHPERYLAAVVAARRDRELGIAPGRAARAQAVADAARRLPYSIPDPAN